MRKRQRIGPSKFIQILKYTLIGERKKMISLDGGVQTINVQ